jgi:hypothetical protein
LLLATILLSGRCHGGVGYSYKGQTIDLLGLNSTVMAHASRIQRVFVTTLLSIKSVLAIKPDVLGTAYGGAVITDTASFVLYENIPGYRNDNFLYLAYKRFLTMKISGPFIPCAGPSEKQGLFIFGYYKKASSTH